VESLGKTLVCMPIRYDMYTIRYHTIPCDTMRYDTYACRNVLLKRALWPHAKVKDPDCLGWSFKIEDVRKGSKKRVKGGGASASDQIKLCGNVWLAIDDPNVKAIS
jgi:hypothetical protein